MKQKDIVFLLISSVILTIAWIVFTIIHKSLSSTIAPITNEQITAINPNFDDKTITELIKRHSTAPVFSLQTPNSTASAEVVPSPIQTSLTPSPTEITIPTGTIPLVTSTQNTNVKQASSGAQTQ